MAETHANKHSRFVMALWLALTALSCKNQLTTQELLDANFFAKGQTPIDLLSPTENQQLAAASLTLSWSSKGVGLYTVQMATDVNFSNLILNKEVGGTTYTLSNGDLIGVNSLTTASYYWRVKISKITNNLQSRTGVFFLVVLPANGSGYAGALYVNSASTASVQFGSKEAPYKKIKSAIAAADALRNNVNSIALDVLVAQGTYAEEIDLIPGISIRGGYDANDWSRNISTNTTTIQGPYDIAVRGDIAISTVYTNTTIIEGFTIKATSVAPGYTIFLTGSSPTIQSNLIYGVNVSGSGNNTYVIYASASSSPAISNNVIIGGVADNGNAYGIYVSASSPTIQANTLIVGPASGLTLGMVITSSTSSSLPAIRNNAILVTGKGGLRYGIYEGAANADAAILKNNLIYDVGTAGNFYIYRDVDGTGQCYSGGASSGGNCNNVADTEADLNVESTGTAGGNISQNPNFANFPNRFDVTLDGGDVGGAYSGSITTLEVTDCTNYVIGEYLEYDRDGIARQITACSAVSGSGIVTFTPALASTSLTAKEIRLWGTNNTNLTIDLHLKASSPCDVRQGGLDLSSLFTTDRDNVTRTATLTCGPANSGAQGWSIGAYEY